MRLRTPHLRAVLHKGRDDLWYVRITSGNGEPWFTSEGYDTPANARRSAGDFEKACGIKLTVVMEAA